MFYERYFAVRKCDKVCRCGETWKFMIEKSKSGVSIIGGADGPTSIFIAGKIQKKSLKVKIRNAIYKHKHKRAEKKIVAGAHTLNELVQYALNKYDLVEINVAERKCIEQRIKLRESLILQHKPEVLGEMEGYSKAGYF